ncbi:MAG: electron transport complex subunit RsxE, partial [Candidatus Marinimicrobia bacterium]|nr:electron transport complex subunit RsxE [Candidatus Neomarinimicrobiota bacterium]
MVKKITLSREFIKGLWDENPVLRMLLGLCPALAVTNSGINGLSMGLAVIFTLVMSSAIISFARNIIPKEVRIPTFIIVIATFVTIADKMLAAYFPDISKALGPFVPLIVVNCIILGRQEAFASKNSVGRAVIDALGMSIGFTITL